HPARRHRQDRQEADPAALRRLPAADSEDRDGLTLQRNRLQRPAFFEQRQQNAPDGDRTRGRPQGRDRGAKAMIGKASSLLLSGCAAAAAAAFSLSFAPQANAQPYYDDPSYGPAPAASDYSYDTAAEVGG